MYEEGYNGEDQEDDENNKEACYACRISDLPDSWIKECMASTLSKVSNYVEIDDSEHLSNSSVATPVPPPIDTDQRMEEASGSAPRNEHEQVSLIDAVPLRIVSLSDDRENPRQLKGARTPLVDGKQIGLPDGWLFERRERNNPKYKGIIDQFYYEPGTNNQFRSIKEVQKHLRSKGQMLNPVPSKPLQIRDQPRDTNAEISSTVGASNQQTSKKNKHVTFDFMNPPEEVTWVLADTQTNDWKAFIEHERVSDDTQQNWNKILTEVMDPKKKYNK